jgi:hypothetical protein
MKFPLRILAFLAAGILGLSASGSQAQSPVSASTRGSKPPDSPSATVVIPGPLRSFLRMAGISQEVAPGEVLPLLARNVFLHGYDNGKPTEYLTLVERYLHQARDLRALSSNNRIYIAHCADAQGLVRALGYRFEHGCSRKGAALITDDAERAFLTVDSGFPITELEEALERGAPFTYAFPATAVPVLFEQRDWIDISTWRPTPGDDLVDVLLHDEALDRLYSAMARIEPHTRMMLMRSPGLRRLLPVSDAFDFYGGQICIPNRAVIVPGGLAAEKGWTELVGARPSSPGEFVLRLLSRDHGWMAAYFDALSRLDPEQQDFLVRGARLKNLYDSYHSTGLKVVASSGVFPRNAPLMLLLTRLRWQQNGEPLIPGNLQVWQEAFTHEFRGPGAREWAARMPTMNSPDRFLMALMAAANLVSEEGPDQVYLAVSAIGEHRPADHPLSAATVSQLAARFHDYQDWYRIFSDFPELDDDSIAQFIKTADYVNNISNPSLRANALGSFQADLGIWEILARQQQIPGASLNASWRQALTPFASVSNSIELFEAARSSLNTTVTAAGGVANPSEDEIVDLLAGPKQTTPQGQRVHAELAARMHAVLDDQRLASLDTIFGLYDGLDAMAHGSPLGSSLVGLAENLHQFEMPRPIFTGGERVAWSPVIYTSRHAELQVQTDLTKLLHGSHSPGQLESARALLTPFLRDTLVGLNYAYYEPPGAQVLHNNPLFVRSHDFSISSVEGVEDVWRAPALIGVGATAGGGAYLMGSLAELPYALASTEEDFIAPAKVQALIWHETVPALMVDAVMPRWWNISKNELHAAALYQRSGEELLAAARTNPEVRQKVMVILRDRFTVEQVEQVYEDYAHPGANPALENMLPADTFYLAAQFRKRYPGQAAQWGPASKELDTLAASDPAETAPARIASDFGAPHPVTNESDDCSLLSRDIFPASGGYSSRLFGESWDSNNLYWARLADEAGYPAVMLNVLAPELTHQMIANIFATYVDDWPALLRALRETGAEFRQGKFSAQIASATGDTEQLSGGASE